MGDEGKELVEVDAFIKEKAKVLDELYVQYEGVTRQVAEAAYKIEKESNDKFGEKGIKVFKEIFLHSKFGHKVSYIKNVKYIPEKLYPMVKELRPSQSPGAVLENKGYSKFADLATMKDQGKAKKIMAKVLDGEITTSKEIRQEIQGVSSSSNKKSKSGSTAVEVSQCPYDKTIGVVVNWTKREIEWTKRE